MSGTLPPQGLCAGCFLCLTCSSFRYPSCSRSCLLQLSAQVPLSQWGLLCPYFQFNNILPGTPIPLLLYFLCNHHHVTYYLLHLLILFFICSPSCLQESVYSIGHEIYICFVYGCVPEPDHIGAPYILVEWIYGLSVLALGEGPAPVLHDWPSACRLGLFSLPPRGENLPESMAYRQKGQRRRPQVLRTLSPWIQPRLHWAQSIPPTGLPSGPPLWLSWLEIWLITCNRMNPRQESLAPGDCADLAEY